MKTFDEIKKILAEHKEEFKEKYKVKEISIFGSYVKGEQKENYLSDIAGVKVDVVPKKSIRNELKEVILKEAIPV